jgi:hypothetical protein
MTADDLARPAATQTRASEAGPWLVLGLAFLLFVDLMGGLVAIAAGENTWAEAWNSDAILAAPWPMLIAQVVLTWGAVRARRVVAIVCAGLLAVACGVSAVSGFFDGQLGKAGLSDALVAGQCFLMAVTAGVAGLALGRLIELARSPLARP